MLRDSWNYFANEENSESIRPRSIFLGKRSWAGAVENCNDDDQSDCVSEGVLRVLGAFVDLTESVGSRNCDCCSGSLVNIKFELDFHCREWYEEPGLAG